MMWFDRGHTDVIFGDRRRETLTVTDRSHGREIHGMRVVGAWEGLRKLEDSQGRHLIVAEADGLLSAAMRESFGALFSNEGRRCIAVYGTPDLVLELTSKSPT